jgi:hypothetical protein
MKVAIVHDYIKEYGPRTEFTFSRGLHPRIEGVFMRGKGAGL